MSHFYSAPFSYSAPSAKERYFHALAEAERAKSEYESSLYERQDFSYPQYHHRPHHFDSYHHQPPHQFFHHPHHDYERRASLERRHRELIAAEAEERYMRQAEAEYQAKLEREVEARAKAKLYREAVARKQREAREEAAARTAYARESASLDDILRFIGAHQQRQQPAQPKRVSFAHPPPYSSRAVCRPQACASACASECPKPAPTPAATQPKVEAHSQEKTIEDLLSMIFGQPVHVRKQAAAPRAPAPAPQPVAGPSKPTSPKTSLKEQLSSRLASEVEPDVRDTIQNLFSTIFQAPEQSSQSKSLKEQLEARLYKDQDSEARDIERAIAESLKDQPTGSGKAKATETPAIPHTPADALAVIEQVASEYAKLSQEFEFPARLDISPPSSPGAHSATSTLSRLTFTANNAPVRYYEQALSQLLSRLDAIESDGDETVRHRRKEVVNLVETALEDVDREVESRAAAYHARDSLSTPPVPIIAEPVPPVKGEVQGYDAEPVTEPVVETPTTTAEEVPLPASTVEEPLVSEIEQVPQAMVESTLTITPTPAPAEDVDTFLLPADTVPELPKVPAHTDVDEEPVQVDGGDVNSDWSEVDA